MELEEVSYEKTVVNKFSDGAPTTKKKFNSSKPNPAKYPYAPPLQPSEGKAMPTPERQEFIQFMSSKVYGNDNPTGLPILFYRILQNQIPHSRFRAAFSLVAYATREDGSEVSGAFNDVLLTLF